MTFKQPFKWGSFEYCNILSNTDKIFTKNVCKFHILIIKKKCIYFREVVNKSQSDADFMRVYIVII